MNAEQRRFLDGVRLATAEFFERNPQQVVTFEEEVGTLCALLSAMTSTLAQPDADKVLDCMHAFVVRQRAGQHGALHLALLRLSQLQAERLER